MDVKLLETVSDIPMPVPSENVGKKIIMFGNPTCPDCSRIKKFFSENAIEYEYHDISSEKEALVWLNSFTRYVPILIMLDQTVMYSPTNEDLKQKIEVSSVNQKVSMVEPEVFDTVIVGGGPAGISATIYAVRKSMKVLLITKVIGGQAAFSGDVENLIGYSMITGADLAGKLKEEVERFKGEGLWIKEGVEVKSVEGSENNFVVQTDSGSYKSKTVIIASGRTPRMLGVPGEKEFYGKGVATCATCDGPLYKGKDVAVIGGGNSALDAAVSLAKVAKSVKIVNLTEGLKGDALLLESIEKAANIEVLNNVTTTEIKGSQFVEELVISDTKTHESKSFPVQGIFIEIGWIPAVDFIPQVAKDKSNQIIVDEFGQTSVPGIWACGDVNNLWGEQIVIAAGEGAKVALVVAEHLAGIPHQSTSNVHMG